MSANAIPRCERVVDFLDHWCAIQPDVVLDEFDGVERTYRQVKRDVDACAASLLGLGIRPGDRVAMLTDPRPEFLTVFLALSRVGASWVGLSPRYTRGELEHVVVDSRPTMLIAITPAGEPTLSDDVHALARDSGSIRHVVSVGDVQSRATPFERLLAEPAPDAAARLEAIAGGVDPDAIALIVYTSGTTGEPKGAMISHRALAIGCWLQGTRIDHDRPRTLANLPVNHIGGVMDLVSVPLAMGGTIHFMGRFSPERTLSLLRSRRITMWGQIPTMFQLVAAVPGFDEADLSSLQSIWWGGSSMPKALVARLRSTGARLGTVYGLTESCVSVAYNDDDADDETLAETVGRPDPRLELRLVDADGHPVSNEAPGEIQVRNQCLMTGYLGLPGATRKAFTADGYLRTGDLAVRRADGNLQLVGRVQDMFKSGGYNVYPREIELALESHPSVDMTAVIAVTDPVYHEVGHAFVTLRRGERATPAELERWCRDRLANYKVPKRIVVRDELPLLRTGKIDKPALKRLVARRDALQSAR